MTEAVPDVIGLDRAALDRARISRDPRFDGKFFIAVTSTGIYCRPICPSRSSKSVNVRYYATAAEAAEAGFRPCLRCRPEAAPGSPAWLGTSAVVRRALRLIENGALDRASLDALAAGVGIGPRHLRRLFLQHLGASPMTVARTRRVHFAKRLLDDTRLPITQIALAAGYGSLRRFNAAFKEVYGRPPRELRRGKSGATDEVILRLAYRPPYDWEQVRAFLARRAAPAVERIDERGYHADGKLRRRRRHRHRSADRRRAGAGAAHRRRRAARSPALDLDGQAGLRSWRRPGAHRRGLRRRPPPRSAGARATGGAHRRHLGSGAGDLDGADEGLRLALGDPTPSRRPIESCAASRRAPRPGGRGAATPPSISGTRRAADAGRHHSVRSRRVPRRPARNPLAGGTT
jgi:methylphosphotriester-DNA--protein-cysteine methyltransferase